jgi:hypothetical protein
MIVLKLRWWTALVLVVLLLPAHEVSAQVAAKDTPAENSSSNDGDDLLEEALAHMQRFEMRLADGEGAVELHARSLLNYGDSARANKNGTVWAFGKQGRPLAILELYQGTEPNASRIHAVTLTGDRTIVMKTPLASVWQPQTTQIEPKPISGAAAPEATASRRLRQMKELARRFTGHEFWDPDNSRFELRLLVQPVHRYRDAEREIQDGGVFILAHGTNPEVVMLIEALGKTQGEARWHYSLARLGSAELHVELDGAAVWKRERTPGIVGKPTDPYWLFWTPSRS